MKQTAEETYLLSFPRLRRYDLCAKRDAPAATIAEMSVEQRREYDRTKRAASRARQREASEAGKLQPTRDAIRDALADAALMLLAVDGPGAEQIRNVLATVFSARPGVVMTVSAHARNGKLKPKLLRA